MLPDGLLVMHLIKIGALGGSETRMVRSHVWKKKKWSSIIVKYFNQVFMELELFLVYYSNKL